MTLSDMTLSYSQCIKSPYIDIEFHSSSHQGSFHGCMESHLSDIVRERPALVIMTLIMTMLLLMIGSPPTMMTRMRTMMTVDDADLGKQSFKSRCFPLFTNATFVRLKRSDVVRR